jgi:hypothetical protein
MVVPTTTIATSHSVVSVYRNKTVSAKCESVPVVPMAAAMTTATIGSRQSIAAENPPNFRNLSVLVNFKMKTPDKRN